MYCVIDLEWDYVARMIDIGMPGYIKTQLQRYKHYRPTRPQHPPHHVTPRRYGKSAQGTTPQDENPTTGPDGILRVQKVVGSILYYARAVDMNILTDLTTLGSEQAKSTTNTIKVTDHLLDYLATHTDAKMRYYASNMVLNMWLSCMIFGIASRII